MVVGTDPYATGTGYFKLSWLNATPFVIRRLPFAVHMLFMIFLPEITLLMVAGSHGHRWFPHM